MFKYDLLSKNTDTLEIENLGVVSLYNTDTLSKLSEDIKNSEDGFGVSLIFNSNNIDSTRAGVYFNNGTKSSNMRMIDIGGDNINKGFGYFSVRRLVETTWINQKDEFLVPNKEHVEYDNFLNDSLVYGLFHSQNSVISSDNFNNEFFWMSVNEMKELADENGYDNLYNDARTASNRHVYNLLFGEERIYDRLSPDAKLVLDKATEMVKESMKMRKFMADDENHLDSWDAGYAQLKLVWKKYMEKDFKEFRQLYKNLEERMRPLVYELGFLMK